MATNIWAVIIGGGGGGGCSYDSHGGGGGAGGYIEKTSISVTETTYNIVIGAGGLSAQKKGDVQGEDGSATTAFGYTANGGGGGGSSRLNSTANDGRNGGCGGGADGYDSGDTGTAGTGNQGGDGGVGYGSSTIASRSGGGGGGAGGNGTNGTSSTGGNGGVGISSSITGTSVERAGGGAGAGTTGGSASGGGGAKNTSGTANTGGGAGGCPTENLGTTGGSGVVIIRFAKSLMSYTCTGSYSVSYTGNDVVITFTGDGTFTPVYWDTISGQVTLGGTGVSGATVRLIDQTTDQEISKTTTDGSGNYSFTTYVYPSRAYHLCVEYTDGSSNKYNAKSLWDVVGV